MPDTNLLAILIALISFGFYAVQRYQDRQSFERLLEKVKEHSKEELEPEETDEKTVKALYTLIGTLQGQNIGKDQLIADLLREKKDMITKLQAKDKVVESLRLDVFNCQQMIAKISKFDDSTETKV